MAVIERDVIVVGAGPAGSICAAYLAKSGLDVLLLDKDIFPRDKACGDMLREGIVAHVNHLEAIDALDKISTCIRNIKIGSNNGSSVTVPFECYTASRYQLDKLLVDTAVSWGAEFRQGCRVLDVICERGVAKGVRTRFRGDESEIRSKLVIGADGASSMVAKSLDIMEENPSGIWLSQRAYFKGVKLERALARDQYDAYGVFSFDARLVPGYFWVLPVGKDGVKKGICNAGVVVCGRDSLVAAELPRRFAEWVSSREEIKRMFQGVKQISPWAGGKLTDITQTMKKAGDGFLLIGDAASLMMPLFNDGLSAAADSAKAAADAAFAAFRKSDFSEGLLENAYEASLHSQRKAKLAARSAGADAPQAASAMLATADPLAAGSLADKLKVDALFMESMYDPQVMDMVVERLGRDMAYRKQVIGSV